MFNSQYQQRVFGKMALWQRSKSIAELIYGSGLHGGIDRTLSSAPYYKIWKDNVPASVCDYAQDLIGYTAVEWSKIACPTLNGPKHKLKEGFENSLVKVWTCCPCVKSLQYRPN